MALQVLFRVWTQIVDRERHADEMQMLEGLGFVFQPYVASPMESWRTNSAEVQQAEIWRAFPTPAAMLACVRTIGFPCLIAPRRHLPAHAAPDDEAWTALIRNRADTWGW
jgi:hypothetical protein